MVPFRSAEGTQQVSPFVSFLRSNRRPILLVLVLVVLLGLIWQLRAVLLPFALGGLLAWLLQPVLDSFERRMPCHGCLHEFKRVVIILAIYAVAAGLLALIVYYVVVVLGRSVVTLVAAAPQLIPAGVAAVEEYLDVFLASLPPSARLQVEGLLAQAAPRASQALVNLISAGFTRIGSSSGMILGFIALPVFVFYLLKDWGRLRQDFYASLPRWALYHVKNVCAIIHDVVGRHLRGQLLLGLIVGIATYVLLATARVPYAMPLAVLGGIGEMVPLVGPWLAGIIGIVIVLATAPDKVVWIALGYIVIQLLENNLLVPKIQGRQMHIHPALAIVLTIVAGSRAGVLGFLLVLPVTMTVIEIIKYVRSQIQSESTES